MYYLLLLAAIFPKTSAACQPLYDFDESAIDQAATSIIGAELLNLFIKSAIWAVIILSAYLIYKYVQLLRKVWGKINSQKRLLIAINLIVGLFVSFWFLMGRIVVESILTPYSIGGCERYEPSIWFTLIDYSVNLLTILCIIALVLSARKLKRLL